MYKTVAIREKMALNLTEHMISIIRRDTVKGLIFEVLESILSNKKEFSDCTRIRVIDELQNILLENLDMITINPRNISDDIWKYINGKVNVANRFTSDQDIAALYIIKQYLTSAQEDIDNFISVFFELIKHADFSEQLKNKTEQYKVRILKCIEY